MCTFMCRVLEHWQKVTAVNRAVAEAARVVEAAFTRRLIAEVVISWQRAAAASRMLRRRYMMRPLSFWKQHAGTSSA